ncbi:MAG TPA: TIGR03435 family protein [Vicinamibacterales bacterium]|nr:TIGR03435 family protein [Vicinamibacterales bacterium]
MTRIRYCPRVVVALFSVLALLAAHQLEAQTQFRVQPTPRLTFEAASIKERDPKAPLGLVGLEVLPGRLVGRCVSLKALLFYAYHLTLSSPITGLQDWADTSCNYSSGTNTYELQATMPSETTDAQAREMMQSLLAERFKLAVHWDTKTRPVFALVIGSVGFKLKPSDPKDDPARALSSIGCPPDDRACRMIVMGSGPTSALARSSGVCRMAASPSRRRDQRRG